MRKDDPGDRMYIPVKGHLGIWLSRDPDVLREEPIAMVHEFEAVGERALKDDKDRRSATVACVDSGETVCLTLEKADYKKLFNVSILLYKNLIVISIILEINHDC